MCRLKLGPDNVTLCCGRRRCPEVRVVGNLVHIRDDDGNQITIEKDQAMLIPEAVTRLTKKMWRSTKEYEETWAELVTKGLNENERSQR